MPRLHRIHLTQGTLKERDLVTAEVDAPIRDATRRNHTATHLLHASLRRVLGTHVKQAGSLVAPDRLRFDFVHASPLSREQIVQIERIVNEQIYRNTPVITEERSTQEAMASGAMALFGEKYGDRVRSSRSGLRWSWAAGLTSRHGILALRSFRAGVLRRSTIEASPVRRRSRCIIDRSRSKS